MEDKKSLKEYKAKIKEYLLQKDKSLTGAIVKVGVTCKITNKHYTLITLLTNNLKSQLAYCTFGCLKKLATF